MPRSSTSQVDADANEHGRRGEDGSRQGGCFSFSKVVYEDMVYVYLCVYINIYIYTYNHENEDKYEDNITHTHTYIYI
jgi:hypothetical protein